MCVREHIRKEDGFMYLVKKQCVKTVEPVSKTARVNAYPVEP